MAITKQHLSPDCETPKQLAGLMSRLSLGTSYFLTLRLLYNIGNAGVNKLEYALAYSIIYALV